MSDTPTLAERIARVWCDSDTHPDVPALAETIQVNLRHSPELARVRATLQEVERYFGYCSDPLATKVRAALATLNALTGKTP